MQISGWNNGFGLRGRYLLPVSGIRERGIETGVFENGMVIVNHRSTPYELPQKYEAEHYQMPVAYTPDGRGILPGHSAAILKLTRTTRTLSGTRKSFTDK